MRDMLAQREQAERHVIHVVVRKKKGFCCFAKSFYSKIMSLFVQRLAEYLDPEVKRWSNGKEGNLRALLSTLQYVNIFICGTSI